jgi:hypothetical protein
MKFNEGDRVRVLSREVTAQDRETNRYFEHMGGLTGTIQNVYEGSEYAVRVDEPSLSKPSKAIHKEATVRMRSKLLDGLSEIQKKELTKEELDFDVHFMLLIHGDDMEKA